MRANQPQKRLVFGALFGDVHRERTAADFLAVELANCFLRTRFIFHRDKAETAGTATTGAGNDDGFFNGAYLGEDLAEIIAGGIERKISYVKSNRHGMNW